MKNLNHRNISPAAILAICLIGRISQADDWGTLKGRFLYDGKPPVPAKLDVTKEPACTQPPAVIDESVTVAPDGGMADIIVWVRTNNVKVHPDYAKTANEKAILDNKHCRFEPHVLGMRVSQPLEVKNSDNFAHNTNIAARNNALPNQVIPAMGNNQLKVSQAETLPAEVACNIHPWMKGWLLVRPDPYFAVSGKDGKFEIKDLPAGTELEFQAWHGPNPGYVAKAKIKDKDAGWTRGRFKMTLKPGDNDLGDIKLDSSQF